MKRMSKMLAVPVAFLVAFMLFGTPSAPGAFDFVGGSAYASGSDGGSACCPDGSACSDYPPCSCHWDNSCGGWTPTHDGAHVPTDPRDVCLAAASYLGGAALIAARLNGWLGLGTGLGAAGLAGACILDAPAIPLPA